MGEARLVEDQEVPGSSYLLPGIAQCSGYAMASFLDTRGIRRREVKRFVLTQAYRLKDHARQMAARGPALPVLRRADTQRRSRAPAGRARWDPGGLVCVFAEGWLQGGRAWGRPVDVQVMPDGALLVSDDGVIYRISYTR